MVLLRLAGRSCDLKNAPSAVDVGRDETPSFAHVCFKSACTGSRTMTRHAACSCGQLRLTIEGEPSRNAMCHCLACQRRTGAVISNQARYRSDQVTVAGKSAEWKRTADSGNEMTFHFCPTCGSTVFWENAGFPGLVSVAIGNLADPSFPGPTLAVWEESRHPWLSLPPDTPPKRSAKQG